MVSFDFGETDAELAATVRDLVYGLNMCAVEAKRRELSVYYRIKPQDNSPAKLIVSVMTEVA